MDVDFGAIDWSRPWLAPLRATAEPIITAPDWRQALNAAASAGGLCNHRGLPVRFVPQSDLPAGMAYETFISETGQVPTRDNLHDFFNALVWLAYPRIKVRLNSMQAAEIERRSRQASGQRGAIRDAATIFDENAAVLVVRKQEWVHLLRAHQWTVALWERRVDFANDCQVFLLGHALMEKLVTPYKAITAHAWPLLAEPGFFSLSLRERQEQVDAMIEQGLPASLSRAGFTPLPVLGIPGWSSRQDESFYADQKVFRPPRQSRA